MPGPRPKPTHLRILEGNPGHRPLNKDEPEPNGDLVDPPAAWGDLKPAAAASLTRIWRETLKEAPAGLLRRLDTYVLEQYCVAVHTFREACAKVIEVGAVIQIGPKKARQFSKNPFLSIRDQQQAILNRLQDQLGFSPASRTRVKITGRRQSKSALGKLRELKLD